MLDLLQLLETLEGYGTFGVTLFLVGGALILVNVATHGWISYRQEQKNDKDKVSRALKPLLRAAADLISRISEIQINQNKELLEAIKMFRLNYPEGRLASLTPADMNRLESTAYRLVIFLSLAKHFERETCNISPFPTLDRVEYFLHNKIPISLKGNLYQAPLLSAELQEELATNYLDYDKQRQATDLSVGSFLLHLNHTDRSEYNQKLFVTALSFFSYDPDKTRVEENIDRDSEHWKHRLALAQFGIYLIDFYHEMAMDPQWEEHRLFFVGLVRQWNADTPKHRYLYEQRDLDKTNYLITYPAKRTSRQSNLFSVLRLVPDVFGLREFFRLAGKWVGLNLRGARFGKRHHPKSIHTWGVRIRANDQVFDIRWEDDLNSIYESVRSVLRARLFDM